MSECPDATVVERFDGDVCADVIDRVDGWDLDGTSLDDGVGTGVANDFQYVSTAPPISNVTPRKGVMMFTSNATWMNRSAFLS